MRGIVFLKWRAWLFVVFLKDITDFSWCHCFSVDQNSDDLAFIFRYIDSDIIFSRIYNFIESISINDFIEPSIISTSKSVRGIYQDIAGKCIIYCFFFVFWSCVRSIFRSRIYYHRRCCLWGYFTFWKIASYGGTSIIFWDDGESVKERAKRKNNREEYRDLFHIRIVRNKYLYIISVLVFL